MRIFQIGESEVLTSKAIRIPSSSLKQEGYFRGLALRMAETMTLHNGIGLAAPQIGVKIRLIVVDGRLIEGVPSTWVTRVTLANPKITEVSEDMITSEEGCLSILGHTFEMSRRAALKVVYQDLDGRAHKITATGKLAVVLQHEIDHLEGRLISRGRQLAQIQKGARG